MSPAKLLEIKMNRILAIAAVLAIVVSLTVFVTLRLSVDSLQKEPRISGYEVTAHFDNVGNLKVGAVVSAAGVKVGQVTDIVYDFETYEAVVTMLIEHRYDRFPLDTSASVLTTGFVGEQYIGLQPGAEMQSLRDGDRLDITSSALILEQIIGQFLYNMAHDNNESPAAAGSPASTSGF